MSTVVHHGLHSRLDSQLMEYRIQKLKISSPKLSISQSLEIALQSCTIVPNDFDAKKLCSKITSLPPCDEKLIDRYVHPSAKHSSVWLSDKSLNLCTENLGSETGSELVENSIFSSSVCSSYESKISVKKVQKPIRNRQVLKSNKFPPPLTTLCVPDCLHFKPCREDGRLILKATRSNQITRSCFQVDRSNGRLRLSLSDSTRSMITCHNSKQTKEDENDT